MMILRLLGGGTVLFSVLSIMTVVSRMEINDRSKWLSNTTNPLAYAPLIALQYAQYHDDALSHDNEQTQHALMDTLLSVESEQVIQVVSL
ncbi:hypothetical protein N9R79_06150 [Vibrio sp.]|nr:hypothetical protein [Vibrio sp.]